MKETHFEMVMPVSDPFMPISGVLTGLMLSNLFWATSTPGLLQRVVDAREVYHAQIGMLLAAALKLVAAIIIVWSIAVAPFTGNFGPVYPLIRKIGSFMGASVGVSYLAWIPMLVE
jgi:hypothetical protein